MTWWPGPTTRPRKTALAGKTDAGARAREERVGRCLGRVGDLGAVDPQDRGRDRGDLPDAAVQLGEAAVGAAERLLVRLEQPGDARVAEQGRVLLHPLEQHVVARE